MIGQKRFLLSTVVLATLHFGAAASQAQSNPELQQAVREAEQGFAQSMADRDHEAFSSFLAEDAVFFGGGTLHGKQAIADAWAAFFEGDDAPFSWAPETVEVVASGTLAHSSGPVRDPAGNITGYFNSIWRLEADGIWRVVFDKGCAAG